VNRLDGFRAMTNYAVFQVGGGDLFFCDRLDGRQIETDTPEMRLLLRDFDAQQAGRAAHVARAR
jgi:hypothetical protein